MSKKEVWATSPRGEGNKDWWTRVGTAFVNKDGSWTIVLDALPTNGKLIVRDEKQREERRDEPPPPRRPPPRAAPRARDEQSPDYEYGRANDDEIPF